MLFSKNASQNTTILSDIHVCITDWPPSSNKAHHPSVHPSVPGCLNAAETVNKPFWLSAQPKQSICVHLTSQTRITISFSAWQLVLCLFLTFISDWHPPISSAVQLPSVPIYVLCLIVQSHVIKSNCIATNVHLSHTAFIYPKWHLFEQRQDEHYIYQLYSLHTCTFVKNVLWTLLALLNPLFYSIWPGIHIQGNDNLVTTTYTTENDSIWNVFVHTNVNSNPFPQLVVQLISHFKLLFVCKLTLRQSIMLLRCAGMPTTATTPRNLQGTRLSAPSLVSRPCTLSLPSVSGVQKANENLNGNWSLLYTAVSSVR